MGSLKDSLKHLGFHWKTNSKSKTSTIDQSHMSHRVADFWAANSALVSSVIRFLHPHSIVTWYLSLLLPKLMYGLELCHLKECDIEYLDRQARLSLKSLFNVSKFSRNYLNYALHVPKLKQLIYKNKITLFIRMLRNEATRQIMLRQLSTDIYDGSFISDI